MMVVKRDPPSLSSAVDKEGNDGARRGAIHSTPAIAGPKRAGDLAFRRSQNRRETSQYPGRQSPEMVWLLARNQPMHRS